MCAEGADKAAFQAMLGPFARQLTRPAASAREVGVGVEAVGEFAPATRRFFGEQACPLPCASDRPAACGIGYDALPCSA